MEKCQGERQLFAKLDIWDLLNLKPATIMGIQARLYEEFGVSKDYLERALKKYNIQTTGFIPEKTDDDSDKTDHIYEKLKPMKYLLAKTRHYSWPKGLGMWLFKVI